MYIHNIHLKPNINKYNYQFENSYDGSLIPPPKKKTRLFDMQDGPHPEKGGKQYIIAKALSTIKIFDTNRVIYPICFKRSYKESQLFYLLARKLWDFLVVCTAEDYFLFLGKNSFDFVILQVT